MYWAGISVYVDDVFILYHLMSCASLSPLVRGQDARGHKAASSRRGVINRCEREGRDGLNTGSPCRWHFIFFRSVPFSAH